VLQYRSGIIISIERGERIAPPVDDIEVQERADI
jgi:hypothetical protein